MLTKIRRSRFFLTFFTIALALALVAALAPTAQASPRQTVAAQASGSFSASYYNNIDLAGQPALTRVERNLVHNWGAGSPGPGVTADTFSARWVGDLFFEGGQYRFTTRSDDGIRLWVGGVLLIDDWTLHPVTQNQAIMTLDAGSHLVRVEYFENTGLAEVSLGITRISGPGGIDESGDETVTISPTSGPPGTRLTVTASGFTPDTPVTVGVGQSGAEPSLEVATRSDDSGSVRENIVVPPGDAQPGETWAVLVLASGTGEKALSGPFNVTELAVIDCGEQYVVQPGDWLAQIARRCGTSLEALLAANPVITDPSSISPGMVLVIPARDAAPQVSISPDRGTVGTEIRVNALGFRNFDEVRVGLGRRGSEPTFSRIVPVDQNGNVQTTFRMTAEAQPGEAWAAVVTAGNINVTSETFTVTGSEFTATALYNINFRSLPNTTSEVMGVIPAGATVPVLARTPAVGWLLVRYDGQEGWIAGWLTDIGDQLPDVPVETP